MSNYERNKFFIVFFDWVHVWSIRYSTIWSMSTKCESQTRMFESFECAVLPDHTTMPFKLQMQQHFPAHVRNGRFLGTPLRERYPQESRWAFITLTFFLPTGRSEIGYTRAFPIWPVNFAPRQSGSGIKKNGWRAGSEKFPKMHCVLAVPFPSWELNRKLNGFAGTFHLRAWLCKA